MVAQEEVLEHDHVQGGIAISFSAAFTTRVNSGPKKRVRLMTEERCEGPRHRRLRDVRPAKGHEGTRRVDGISLVQRLDEGTPTPDGHRMEMWDASLQTTPNHTKTELADVTVANGLGHVLPDEGYFDMTNVSHV